MAILSESLPAKVEFYRRRYQYICSDFTRIRYFCNYQITLICTMHPNCTLHVTVHFWQRLLQQVKVAINYNSVVTTMGLFLQGRLGNCAMLFTRMI